MAAMLCRPQCVDTCISWWRHQMEIFSALVAICAGNSPVTGEFPSQRPVTRSFDVFFDLRLNRRLSKKKSRGWWFETSSRPLLRHCNAGIYLTSYNPNENENYIFSDIKCGQRKTRTRWRRVKTLGQHQVGVNLQSHAQHQLWISTWHIFHEFHKIMPG